MILKKLKVKSGNILDLTNCYIIQDEKTKDTMVIDPGGQSDLIIEMLKVIDAKVKYIYITHCHADHIVAVLDVKKEFGGKILIHRQDSEGLNDKKINLCEFVEIKEVSIEADSIVDDGDLLHVGEIELQVIHTPGHTKGSTSLYCKEENIVFSGDTLFHGTWGRTDLPTSNFERIIESITDRLLVLPDDTIVYPGHGKSTRILEEKPIYLKLQPRD